MSLVLQDKCNIEIFLYICMYVSLFCHFAGNPSNKQSSDYKRCLELSQVSLQMLTSQIALCVMGWSHCQIVLVVCSYNFLLIVTPIVGVCNCSMFVVRHFMSILVLQSS